MTAPAKPLAHNRPGQAKMSSNSSGLDRPPAFDFLPGVRRENLEMFLEGLRYHGEFCCERGGRECTIFGRPYVIGTKGVRQVDN